MKTTQLGLVSHILSFSSFCLIIYTDRIRGWASHLSDQRFQGARHESGHYHTIRSCIPQTSSSILRHSLHWCPPPEHRGCIFVGNLLVHYSGCCCPDTPSTSNPSAAVTSVRTPLVSFGYLIWTRGSRFHRLAQHPGHRCNAMGHWLEVAHYWSTHGRTL